MTPLALLLLKLAAVAAPLAAVGAGGAHLSAAAAGLAGAGAGRWRPSPCWLRRAVSGASWRWTWSWSRLAAGDALTLPGRKAFSAERTAGRVASLRKPHAVTLTLLNHARRRYRISVRDGVPQDCTPSRPSSPSASAAAAARRCSYLLRPRRRGAFAAERVYLRARSRLGFWQRLLEYPPSRPIHVYPDMKQLGQYALLARTNRLSLLGVRRTRRIGQDNEFERLRDYTIDDNYKHINWRATARRGKLTVQDYQTNQSQRLIFLVDCGRMMTNEAAGLSLLDHALNAMLMLSYVALRQGDSVGLVSFSDEIHSYIPPRGGMRQMNRLLHASFDRFPRLVESRYDQAFRYLASHCRKRSLVVLVTNLIDEVNANQVRALPGQPGRASSAAGRAAARPPALRGGRARASHRGPALAGGRRAEILTWRHQVLTDCKARGCWSWTSFPSS